MPEEDGDDVIVYELNDWTAEQRGSLDLRLEAEGIERQWEMPDGDDVVEDYSPGKPWEVATDLVVGELDEEVVDALLDEIEAGGEELPAETGDGRDDEVVYHVMSDLYVAADRLKNDPDDLALAGEFFDAADAVRATDAPFGIDGEVWRRVQALSTELCEALEGEADDDVVRGYAQTLRDILFSYV